MKKKTAVEAKQGTEIAVRKRKGLAAFSIIVYLLDKLSDKIYNALINGFFGYIFTSYSNELTAYRNGFVVSCFKSDSRSRRILRTVREYLSRSFDTSFILSKLRHLICRLAFVPLKLYGSFFLSFGSYTLLVYFVHLALPVTGKADSDYIFIGAAICLLALPMYFSSLSLAEAVRRGRITSALFVDVFGYKDESFEDKYNKKLSRPAISVLLGLCAGLSTLVMHPFILLSLMLGIVIASIIMVTPEVGVVLALFGLPFFSIFDNPTLILTALVLVTSLSYAIKIVRGKRILRLELLDIAVLFFILIILFSGAVSVGGRASYDAALMSCVLAFGYFLVVNLVRTQAWLKRCSMALVSSGAIVSLIGVLQYMLGYSVNNWLDRSYFPDIAGRATALFDNPNYLGAYLALILPIAVFRAVSAKNASAKVLGFITCTLMTVCAVLTWSRGTWLALIISLTIFFLIFSKKTMRALYCLLLSVPFLPFVLPSNVVSRFMSIGNMTDSSTSYRVYTWLGSIELLKDNFWGGIGYGAEAFATLYPAYAYAGMESAVHSHSLYLQIMISMGIGGIICFALILLFYFQKTLEYFKSPVSHESMLFCAAALCSVIALSIMGLFDYVWYNYSVFFLFWTVMALGIAAIRIGKRELARHEMPVTASECAAAVDI